MTYALGYSFQGFAAAYLASYGAKPNKLKASLSHIQKAAGELLGLISVEAADAEEQQAA